MFYGKENDRQTVNHWLSGHSLVIKKQNFANTHFLVMITKVDPYLVKVWLYNFLHKMHKMVKLPNKHSSHDRIIAEEEEMGNIP